MREHLFAVSLCLCGSALAAEPAATTGSPVQFVDRSYVSLPRTVGIYELESVKYDPAELAAGISSAYSLRGAPRSLTLNVYVFPQGQAEEAEIVEKHIQAVEAVIRMQKDYSDIIAGPRTPITIDAPAPTLPGKNGRKIPMVFGKPESISREEARKRAHGAITIAAAVAASQPPTQNVGLRQTFALKMKDVPSRSAAVQFYRQLFNIKLRISVPESAMEQEEFDALVDAAARALVPKIDIRNVGQCGQAIVFGQDSGDEKLDAEANARALLEGQRRLFANNCALTDAGLDELPEGYEHVELVYPPGTWQRD